MRGLLLCLLLTSCAPAFADSLYLGAWSTHLDSEYNYNETHNLVAYERDSWAIGYFRNSYNRDTVFVSKEFSKRNRLVQYGAMVGVMRGYRKCYGDNDTNADVCPMVVPYVEPMIGDVRPRFMLVGNALAVTLKAEF